MDLDNMPFKIIDNTGIVESSPIVEAPSNLETVVQPQIMEPLAIAPAVNPHNLNERRFIAEHQFDEHMGDGPMDATFATVGAGLFITILILGLCKWLFSRRSNIWNGLRMIFGAQNEVIERDQEPQPVPIVQNDVENNQQVPQLRARDRDNQPFISIPGGVVIKQKR